jgi:DNA-directed RNA polymerase specialized sigma24 family protein
MAWLRRILARSLADQVKHHRRKERDHQPQESLDLLLEQSSLTAEIALATHASSPSERAVKRE